MAKRTQQTVAKNKIAWSRIIGMALVLTMLISWIISFFVDSIVVSRIAGVSTVLSLPWLFYGLLAYGSALFFDGIASRFRDFLRSYRNKSADRILQRRYQNKKKKPTAYDE